MKVLIPYKALKCSLLCLFVCLSLTFKASPASSSNFSLDFELVNGLIVIEASTDFKKGSYILDTGCSLLAINGSVESKDIKLISSEFETVAQDVQVNHFQFGNIVEQQVEAVQFDMQAISKLAQRNIDGLIGTQLFSEYNVIIDYELSKVFFFVEHTGLDLSDAVNYSITKAKITRHNQQSFVTMEIAGQSMKMLLDSGANISVVDQKWVSALDRHRRVNTKSTVQDDFVVKHSTLSHITIEDLPVLFRDLSSLQQENSFDGILSLSSLNAGKVMFDFQHDQVIFFWRTDSVASLD